MNNSYKTLIVVLTLLFVSCSKEDSLVNCETSDLGIDELSKYSFINYTTIDGVKVISEYNTYRWDWMVKNDTIEISGARYYDALNHVYLKKEGNCVKFLFARNVFFDDGGVILDADTGEVINSGFSWNTYNDLDFKIQEYIEDEKLVFSIEGVNYWIDFTLDIQRKIPLFYEQYLNK